VDYDTSLANLVKQSQNVNRWIFTLFNSCSEGYYMWKYTTRVCQGDGQWSGSESTCEG